MTASIYITFVSLHYRTCHLHRINKIPSKTLLTDSFNKMPYMQDLSKRNVLHCMYIISSPLSLYLFDFIASHLDVWDACSHYIHALPTHSRHYYVYKDPTSHSIIMQSVISTCMCRLRLPTRNVGAVRLKVSALLVESWINFKQNYFEKSYFCNKMYMYILFLARPVFIIL